MLLNLHILAGALAVEALLGYPDALFRRIRHPVVWIGALIGALDRFLNREDWSPGGCRLAGVVTLLLLVAAAAVPCGILQATLGSNAIGIAVLAVLCAALPAQRSLWSHVRAVADALDGGGLAAGRQAVSHIVGRDPDSLDEAGVVRAAIESLAENFSDGVVAPAVWGAVLGLPGMAAYKAVNTADSMIGHRSARYAAFGWAAARCDDVVNLPASRLAALWLTAAALVQRGADPAGALRAVRRDAGRHRSPNAGWPEAAMAGALGLRLAGPRTYHYGRVEDAWMGDGRAEATVADLRRALSLYGLACAIQFGVAAAGLAALWWVSAPG